MERQEGGKGDPRLLVRGRFLSAVGWCCADITGGSVTFSCPGSLFSAASCLLQPRTDMDS